MSLPFTAQFPVAEIPDVSLLRQPILRVPARDGKRFFLTLRR